MRQALVVTNRSMSKKHMIVVKLARNVSAFSNASAARSCQEEIRPLGPVVTCAAGHVGTTAPFRVWQGSEREPGVAADGPFVFLVGGGSRGYRSRQVFSGVPDDVKVRMMHKLRKRREEVFRRCCLKAGERRHVTNGS